MIATLSRGSNGHPTSNPPCDASSPLAVFDGLNVICSGGAALPR